MVCEVFWVVVAGCLCLSLLCVLCPSCGAVPWGSVQLGGFGPCWIMDGGEEGMRAGLEGTYPPPSLTLPTVPHPSPTLSFPPAFLSAQTVAIHAWREVGWGWLEMCLALSFCLSALPFFFSLHFRPYLALPLPPRFELVKSKWQRSIQPKMVCRCWENETKT